VIASIKDFYKRSRSFPLSHFHFLNQALEPRIKDLLSNSCTNLLTPKPATLQCSASSLPLFLLCLIFIALSTLKLQHQPFVLPNTPHQPVLPPSLLINPTCLPHLQSSTIVSTSTSSVTTPIKRIPPNHTPKWRTEGAHHLEGSHLEGGRLEGVHLAAGRENLFLINWRDSCMDLGFWRC
jgi:hypothetical protein